MKFVPPRAAGSARDLDLAYNLLSRGLSNPQLKRQYVHPGDLKWWLYNWMKGEGIFDSVYLWEDSETSIQANGIALFFPWGAFSVFVDPSLVGSKDAIEFFDWAEARAGSIAVGDGTAEVHCVNVAKSNESFLSALQRKGFRHIPEDLILMSVDLKAAVSPAPVLEGFSFRRATPSDYASRAEVQHRAFASKLPLEEYQLHYSRFSNSPGYPNDSDLMLVAPDGRIAGFCIVWPDVRSGVGLIEPVGVDPGFRNLGLGTSLLLHGLDGLRTLGMTQARVSVLADNPRARGLYEKVGFREVDRFVLHEKKSELVFLDRK